MLGSIFSLWFFEFLESRPRAVAAALADRGQYMLRDAAERLAEALCLAKKLADKEQAMADLRGHPVSLLS